MATTEQDIQQVWLSLRNLVGAFDDNVLHAERYPEYRDARHMLQVTEGMTDRTYRERIEKLEDDNRSLLRQRDEAITRAGVREAVVRGMQDRIDNLESKNQQLEAALREVIALTPPAVRQHPWIRKAQALLAPEGGAEGPIGLRYSAEQWEEVKRLREGGAEGEE